MSRPRLLSQILLRTTEVHPRMDGEDKTSWHHYESRKVVLNSQPPSSRTYEKPLRSTGHAFRIAYLKLSKPPFASPEQTPLRTGSNRYTTEKCVIKLDSVISLLLPVLHGDYHYCVTHTHTIRPSKNHHLSSARNTSLLSKWVMPFL